MTSREARRIRRAAERKQRKKELKSAQALGGSAIGQQSDSLFASNAPSSTADHSSHSSARGLTDHQRDMLELAELDRQSAEMLEDLRTQKAARLTAKAAAVQSADPTEDSAPPSAAKTSRPTRAQTNRANAQHSTGPRTATGKARAARNSFKHGLYSQAVVLETEDPSQYEALLAQLRAEHLPANTTEDILVNELAAQFWRLRRMRASELRALNPNNLDESVGMAFLALVGRMMGAAERGFYKALAALTKLQKARGFVPAKTAKTDEQPASDGFVPSKMNAPAMPSSQSAEQIGFVPSNSPHVNSQNGFVPQNEHENA